MAQTGSVKTVRIPDVPVRKPLTEKERKALLATAKKVENAKTKVIDNPKAAKQTKAPAPVAPVAKTPAPAPVAPPQPPPNTLDGLKALIAQLEAKIAAAPAAPVKTKKAKAVEVEGEDKQPKGRRGRQGTIKAGHIITYGAMHDGQPVSAKAYVTKTDGTNLTAIQLVPPSAEVKAIPVAQAARLHVTTATMVDLIASMPPEVVGPEMHAQVLSVKNSLDGDSQDVLDAICFHWVGAWWARADYKPGMPPVYDAEHVQSPEAKAAAEAAVAAAAKQAKDAKKQAKVKVEVVKGHKATAADKKPRLRKAS